MQKVFFLLLFVANFSFGQFKNEIDSLEFELKKAKTIEEKIKLHDLLFNRNFLDNIKIANFHKQQLFEIGKKHNNSLAFYKAYYLSGVTSSIYSKKNGAIPNLTKANQYAKKLDDVSLICESSIKLANVYIALNDFDNAQFHLKEAIKITTKRNALLELSRAYMVLGEFYQSRKAYVLALNSYLKTDSIQVNHKLDKNTLGENLMHLGQLHQELKLFNQAEKNFKAAKVLFDETQNKIGQMHAVFKLGDVYFLEKNYKNALSNYKKVYNFYENNSFIGNFSEANLSIGRVYMEEKKYKKSLEYFNKSLEIQQEGNYYHGQARSNIHIGDVYFIVEEFDKSKNHYLRALELVNKNNLNSLKSNLYLKLAKTYGKTKNYDEANKFYVLNEEIKDSISHLNENQEIFELETKYQTENKQKQIKLLSTQNELAQKEKYIYIGLLGLLALIGGSLFYSYRNKIKTAQKLKELNELKSRFFANISHEFRTPLTLIKSPVQSLQSEISDENQKSKLHLIDTNSTRMLELVDQLLELSKIDGGNLKLILKEGNISSFLLSIMEPFNFQAKENHINFSSSIEKTTENSLFDKDVIEKIVTNLVTNAFKYKAPNEAIAFGSSVTNSTLKLVVSNSGSDIKKEDLPKLFERFYQKNEDNQGVGIGLALVKELVDLCKGTIEATVSNGELSFAVNIPLLQTNDNAIVIPSKVQTANVINSSIAETELPILLIVDDNAEIRNVLKDIFKINYQIIEAQDGEAALKLAKKEIPDCIISDVMMPKIDGFEFTKQIKNNELTSFIPVILLTAKTSDEAHLEGLKSTADAFLTKPFNNEIVKATVLQLIEERKKLHTRYSQELVLRPVDIVINSVEEKFIEKLQVILEKQLSNSDFTAEDFAAEVGMSRMQLHRKLKSLLGVSSTEFLRNERLKVSTELLKKGNGNISEIAYSVGFNDVSYFSKCFKEMYHCTPTEYIEKS
ncbi:hybrid sensor histidine kinase/response regulator transcription factor [Flavobacterium sp. UBA7682]|uniref:hybrid sensor histidine kinase/response regulator transcription factor n=1 Tax=Flavobacterium sp. UBA7682 TaxID=1946560 RepID=UPI0025BAA108|nr:response regulator [Flavobacterium sp. UBA7682]